MELAGLNRILPQTLRRILTSSALVAGGRVVGAVLGISLQILLARYFGAEELGLFFLSMAVASVLAVACGLGYPILVAKVAAQASEQGDEGWIEAFLRRARRDVAVISIGAAVLACACILLLPSLSQTLRLGLVIGVLTAPVIALFRLNSATANAHRHFLTGYFPELIVRPLLLLAATLLLIQVVADPGMNAIIALNSVIVVGVAGWQFSRVRALRFATSRTSNATTSSMVDGAQVATWRRAALQLSVAALFTAVFADLSILMAGLFLDQTNLGIFGVCLRISFFVAFAIQAIHQIVFRDMADEVERKDREALRVAMARGNVIALVLSGVALVCVSLFANPLFSLFGPEFGDGASCLLLLMLAQVLRALAGPGTQVLALTGHERATIPVYLAGTLLLAVLVAVLIPSYGLDGAGVAVLVTTGFWTFGLMLLARRHAGVNSATLDLRGSSTQQG